MGTFGSNSRGANALVAAWAAEEGVASVVRRTGIPESTVRDAMYGRSQTLSPQNQERAEMALSVQPAGRTRDLLNAKDLMQTPSDRRQNVAEVRSDPKGWQRRKGEVGKQWDARAKGKKRRSPKGLDIPEFEPDTDWWSDPAKR